MAKKHTAQCACGAVKFEFNTGPTFLAVCHAGDDNIDDIMLDVNCLWSAREALDMTRKLRPFNLKWLEEPVWPPENYSGLARIRREGGIPIAAGENASTLMDFQHLLEAQAVDFIQPSPAKMGGLTELSGVFALANANNTTVMVDTFYDGPGLLAAVHASAALGGPGAMVEWRYFDLEAQLYGDDIIPNNGAIAVPQSAGLGLEPRATSSATTTWLEQTRPQRCLRS
jgi:L-alanine-DL-glutamate epimerase-like enolase superfamily enzyme